MTTATFKHIDTTSYTGKPWSKVDGPGTSFKLAPHERSVQNLRDHPDFTTDNAGFALYRSPATEKTFESDSAVRGGYYSEIESLLKERLPGVKKVVMFDHTIRRRDKNSPRQPVQQVHVDQTPAAAAARVRRHIDSAEEAEELLRGRYQIINVWRPIAHPASDHPLAVVDWRSTTPSDFIPVNLLYPTRPDSAIDNDDRGKEKLPTAQSEQSTEGYEVRGETMAVAPSEKHEFYYVKDMTPEEVLLLKCFDSFGEGMGEEGGRKGLAVRTPHTAFDDPNTPEDAPGRQSIEVRCLVFYK